jgi:hypothetical protein
MIIDDLISVLPEGEYNEVFERSYYDDMDEVEDIDFLDYLYEVQCIELRPRAYREDIWNMKWCVEVYDWSKKDDCHILNLTGFSNRKEAVHQALIWYYKVFSVKNS